LLVCPTDDPVAAAKASGLLSAGGGIVTLFSIPFWGVTSDAIGRKPVINIGLLGNAFAYGLVGCIPSIHALIVGVIITRVTVATVTTCEYNNFAKLSRKRVL
jgi:MFS family permease